MKKGGGLYLQVLQYCHVQRGVRDIAHISRLVTLRPWNAGHGKSKGIILRSRGNANIHRIMSQSVNFFRQRFDALEHVFKRAFHIQSGNL